MNIKLFPFLFLFLMSPLFSFSQTWNHYDWDEADQLSDSVFTDAKNFFISRNKDNIFVGDMNKVDGIDYAAELYTDYKSGNIYPGFYGYENYIRKVLKQVIKDSIALRKIKIYFYYSSECTMSMDALGNIRVYVGIFNYINSEAELAGVLAHEYGHFINNDVVSWKYSVSKQKEATADYVAIKLIQNSPYSTKGMSNIFKTFKRFEIKGELLLGNNMVHDFTHPDPGDRLKQVRILSKDSSNIGKKMFVVDSVMFMNLKRVAGQESINIMVGNMEYHEIMEHAFTHYLYEPDDAENLALLIESLRRYIAINPKKAEKQFIIDFYKGKGSKRSDNYKFVDSDETSLLRYLNKGLLHLKSNDLSKIKAKDLLDSLSVKFTSYQQAHAYFNAKANSINCKPCQVTSVFKDEKKPVYNEAATSNNTVFDCMDFLNDLKSQPQFSENLYILNLPTINDLSSYDTNKVGTYGEFLKAYAGIAKTKAELKNVYLITDLSFHDQHQINFINKLAESIVEPGFYYSSILSNIKYKNTYRNVVGQQNATKNEKLYWKNFAPENYQIFKKHKVKNIYIINFDLLTFEVATASTYGLVLATKKVTSRSWQFKKVSLDDQQSFNIVYQHKIGTTQDSKDESLKNFAYDLKVFMSFNR